MVLIYWSWGWPCVSPEAWVFQFYLSWGKLEALVETSLKLKKLRVPLQTGEKSYFGKVDVKNDVHQNFETIKKNGFKLLHASCLTLQILGMWTHGDKSSWYMSPTITYSVERIIHCLLPIWQTNYHKRPTTPLILNPSHPSCPEIPLTPLLIPPEIGQVALAKLPIHTWSKFPFWPDTFNSGQKWMCQPFYLKKWMQAKKMFGGPMYFYKGFLWLSKLIG